MTLWQRILGIPPNCERRFLEYYQEPLATFIEVGHFKVFDASTIMWVRDGECGVEGSSSSQVMAPYEEP